MKSRLFLEIVTSQFIATAMGEIYQCSIVDCNAVFRNAASTGFNFLLVIVFPA